MLKKIFIGLFIPALALAQPRLDTTSSSLSASNARVTQVIFADGTTQTTAGVSGNTTVTNLPDTLVYRNISNAWSAAQTLPAGSTILGATFGLDHWASDTGTATQVGSWFYPTNATTVGLFIGANKSISLHRPDGTVSGGIARRTSAVDLQTYRSASDHVAEMEYSVIGGGYDNEIDWGNDNPGYDVIGGGRANFIGIGRYGAHTIAGGYGNRIGRSPFAGSSARGNFIGGGGLNEIEYNTAAADVIVGGINNESINNASYKAIVGGNGNSVRQSYAFIGGGQENTVNGQYGVVSGGYQNEVQANYAQAGGYRAKANGVGSFVWSAYDGTTNQFLVTSSNVAVFRVSGGFGINTNNPQESLHVDGKIQILDVKIYASGTNLYLTDGSTYTNLITTTPL